MKRKNSKQDSCAIWLQVRYTQFKVESLVQKKQKKIPNWPTSLPQSDKLLVCDMLATVQFEAFHHTVLIKLYIPSTIITEYILCKVPFNFDRKKCTVRSSDALFLGPEKIRVAPN